MGITIEAEDDAGTWNRYVDRAPETNPLHRYEALEVLGDHADARLHPLVGYSGHEPIGLFPVFETDRGPLTVLSSPPSQIHTFQLGPATLNLEKMKRPKAERRRRAFLDGCFSRLDDEVGPDLVKVRTDPRFDDVRPLQWNGFSARPYYTYFVDLRPDEEELLREFSRNARRAITDTDAEEYTIEVGDDTHVRRIMDQLEGRLKDLDASMGVDGELVLDLYDALPDGMMHPYVCLTNGEVVCGVITLEYDDVIYFWKGGVTTDTDIPASDLLHWRIMRDAIERGRTYYDLLGANIPRLCEYKAKFAPETRIYFTLHRRNTRAKVVRRAKWLARLVR